MNARTCTPVLLLLVTLVGLLHPEPATGQEPGSKPIFLAIPESFPDLNARVVLMREPGRDIVLLAESDASPETLKVALMLLRRLEREHPPVADRGQLVPITGFVPRSAIPADERAHLETLLAELRERPFANVGNLGSGRWMPYRDR